MIAPWWVVAAALSYQRDPSAARRFEELPADAWQRLPEEKLNAGYSRDALFFCSDTVPGAIVVVPGTFDDLRFVEGEPLLEPSALLPSSRAARATSPRVCFRVVSAASIDIEPYLTTERAFYERIAGDRMADGAYYGLLGAALLFNLLAFAALRERALLAYVAYQASFICMQLGFDGVWLEALPLPRPLAHRFGLLWPALSTFYALVFAQSFLAGAQRALRMMQAAVVGLLVFVLAAPLSLVYVGLGVAFSVIPPVLVVLALPAARLGEPGARLFVAGFGVLAVTIVVTALADLGVSAPWLANNRISKLGSAFEVVLLGAALSLRIAAVRGERDRALRRAVEARLEGLGTLVAGVAHEIGNPLNAASAAAGELARRTAGNDALEGIVSLLRRGLDRIERILRALRETIAGRNVAVQEIDVAAAVDDTVALVAAAAVEKGVRLEREGAASMRIHAAPGELEQVLHNLLRNALDATPSEGSVRIGWRERRGSVEIDVHDSGPGIPAAIGERIFDPFFTTKPPQQGTGLGLWLSAELCRRRGGELTWDRGAAPGARFVITWPKAS